MHGTAPHDSQACLFFCCSENALQKTSGISMKPLSSSAAQPETNHHSDCGSRMAEREQEYYKDHCHVVATSP